MALTKRQGKAKRYVLRRQKGALRIDGHAGTGKTFWAVNVIHALIKRKKKVLVLCPTHTAKIQFSSKLPESDYLEVKTVASYLSQFPSEDESGRLVFGRGMFGGSDHDYIFVDEASMVSDYETTELLKAQEHSFITFLGDMAQLRPVMKKSAAHVLDTLKTYHFTKQQRNAGPILALCNTARNEVIYPELTTMSRDSAGNPSNIIVHKSHQEFLDDFIIKLKEAEKPYDVVYLAYTNAAVSKMRLRCHLDLYGRKVFNKNQYIRLATPCEAGYNGNLCKILKIEYKNKRKIGGIDCWVYNLKIHNLDLESIGYLEAVSPKNQTLLEIRIEELYTLASKAFKKNKEDYEYYKDCIREIRSVAFLRSPFASTLHTSQGRSIPTVYVDTFNVDQKGNDKRRLLYVGYSRTMYNLNTVHVDKRGKVTSSIRVRKAA